jgi:translation initiation factor 2 beta subunit (eIF-2beta)/eIF-5
MEDLNPEQQFEESQRRMPPAKYTPAEDVTVTDNSIKIAEELVGDKMASPVGEDAKVYKPWAKYHLHTADEEDEDTKETRRSVKTVEKNLKTRFWINAREKKDYDKMVMEGKISDAELEFKESKD